ncbi:MAG: hypothetical protein U1E27_05500, partial [Kiritimatiellia bacterium]|nr:hypothetical protein [Kiritimatiellia bacterium]
MESEPNQPVDGDVLLHLNFVPKWARGASTANPYADFAGSDRGRERDSRDRSPSRGGSRPERGGRDRDRAPGGERRMGDRSSRPSGDRFPRSDSRAPHTPASRPEPAVPNALQWVEVRFLPERRALGAAVKRIQKSRRAFPLSELAGVFLSNPDFHQVKLEFSRQAPPGTRLAQCDLCGRLFLDASAAREHVAGAHREDFFTVETRELPPPTGVFTCVARCRIGNILLGPPNHHSFNDRLMELHSTRFSNLSLDEFRRNIETVH